MKFRCKFLLSLAYRQARFDHPAFKLASTGAGNEKLGMTSSP